MSDNPGGQGEATAASPDGSSTPAGSQASSLDRNAYLGSADAPQVVGLSKWGSPLSVWMRKVGLTDDDRKPSLRMWLGERLEPIVLELYAAKTGRLPERVVGPDAPPLLHPEHPFIGAHPDYERLEVKTSRSAYGWGDDGQTVTLDNLVIPVGYFAQVQHQLAVTGWDWSDLAVLIGHDDIRRYTVPADADFIGRLIVAEIEFWGYVERREAPPDDDPEAREALLRALYPTDSEPARPPTPEELVVLAEWREARRALRAAEVADKMATVAVRELVGPAAGLIGEVSYRASTTKRIDPEAVRLVFADRPDLLEGVTRVTTSRTLRDTKKETEE